MRKYTPLIVVFVSLAATMCFSYLAFTARPERNELVAVPSQHNFGVVKPAVLTHTFQLTNHTKYPVQISQVIAGCSCESIRVSAKRLAPGEATTVRCDLNVHGRRGEYSSGFRIIYRVLGPAAPNDQVLPYLLRATVETVVGFEPADLEFVLGQAETKRVRISSARPGVKVLSVRSSHHALSARVTDDGLAFDVSFDAVAWKDRPGRISLDIETTCDTERQIPLSAYVVDSSNR